jgi:hypothetical protein
MAKETNNWPELAAGLYEQLTGRDAEINYEFEDFQVSVPSSTSDEAKHADWKVNGKLKIYTNERSDK